MKSRFNKQEAAKIANDDLAMRVYTSRLLGADEDLVMHGGGNTSVKSVVPDFFGRDVEVLLVKGSGWDLKTIEKPGFSPLRLQEAKMLATLDSLTDDDMAKQLRGNLLDQAAPSPSVEAILHAVMPFKFVDHTHTDAVVTLTNNPNGEKIIAELYPDCLVLPYVMPGFILSKQVFDALQTNDLNNFKGIILLHHGVFTYSDDAEVAYENMIELVDRAEQHIAAKVSLPEGHENSTDVPEIEKLLRLCFIRKSVSDVRGNAQLALCNDSQAASTFASLTNVEDLATRGPITPDHVIRTKRTACIFAAEETRDSEEDSTEKKAPAETETLTEAESFANDYRSYFEQHKTDGLTILDAAPRWGVWKDTGTLAFGNSLKECKIIADITRHTVKCIRTGEALGGWQALSPAEIFELEYWVLEQAKLKKAGNLPPHQGKVALVTGAAGGIGLATAKRLNAEGAIVVGLDIDPEVTEKLNTDSLIGRRCDVTNEEEVRSEVHRVVKEFGGMDILVLNAGVFEAGETIDQLKESWDRAIDINLTATQRVLRHCIPFLKRGVDPSVIIVGSRNFTAPGSGASSYSVSKAGVTQLGRVAALELAGDGVRVNTLHPDAVFDTGVWSQETLEKSAARYDMTVEEYKTKNLLGKEITSVDIAAMISTVAGPVFAATTGAQIPVDGGNDRVI